MSALSSEPATGLTRSQVDLMRVLQELTDAEGVCPTYDQLAHELESRSRGRVHNLLRLLADRGYVRLPDGRARAITIVKRVPMPDFGAIEFVLSPALAGARP